MCTKIT